MALLIHPPASGLTLLMEVQRLSLYNSEAIYFSVILGEKKRKGNLTSHGSLSMHN